MVKILSLFQKGPFINGTAVTISELDDSLVATGKNFNTQIADNKGSFEIRNIELTSDYVQLTANGFYFDEVKGEKSAAQLTLFALANIASANSINVNILSHLEKDRAHFLIRQGKSFAEAKKQAQQEILAIFNIAKENIGNSETLDISQEGDDNAILLAISTILQGNNTVAELSELLANINTDIKEDGELNSNSSREKLVSNAKSLDLAAIREHIEKRYDELGVTSTIPNFEKYIDSDGDGILNGDEDDTPDEFTFDPQIDVAISQSVISNEITILGIKEGGKADIYITNGNFIINDQQVADTVTQVANGDKVKIITTASDVYSTTVKAKVTIGSLVKFFEVTTHDYIPEAFSFTSKKDVAIDTFVVSDTITLSGIPYATPASINNGVIIKNGVALETDTTSFKEGDQVAIKLLSNENFSTSTSATLNVNGIEGIFEVITDDYAPDDFSFTSKENVAIDSFIISETITLSGIPHPTPASINNGIIIKNGIELETDTTSLKEGDQVAIKLLSSENFIASTNATLSVNGIEGTFEVTTDDYIPDDFSFTSIENAKRNTLYFSDTITLSGLLHPTPAMINNGKLFVNDIAYNVEETAWVESGDHIVLKLQSSSEFLTKTTSSLQVGGVSKLFEITTRQVPWVRKADYPGKGVLGTTSFIVNGKVYICTGQNAETTDLSRELYEYDPATNKWARKADFGGMERFEAIGFSINGKGYVGLGTTSYSGNGNDFLDFWEYDPLTDTWKKIADFPGEPRIRWVSFVLNNKVYIGLGNHYDFDSDINTHYNDFWEYDPATNQWVSKNNFTGGKRWGAWAFALDGKAYVGAGSADFIDKKDVWAYDFATDSWIQKNDYVETVILSTAITINNSAFIITDEEDNHNLPIYQYDAINDSWQLAEGNMPSNAVGPAISSDEKGYVLTEDHKFWEFTPIQP